MAIVVHNSEDVGYEPVFNFGSIDVPCFSIFVAASVFVPETPMDQEDGEEDEVEVGHQVVEPTTGPVTE